MKRFKSHTGRGLYRSRQGAVAGVCRGLAEYFDFSVTWVRTIIFLVMLLSGVWPMVLIYIVTALIMKPEPVKPIKSMAEQDFYDSYIHSRQGAARNLKSRYEKLERRIRRLEDHVTTREFDFDRRLNGA